ncbi:hypothetical protein JCM31598_27920 [Desulfonatronum parangueonense]
MPGIRPRERIEWIRKNVAEVYGVWDVPLLVDSLSYGKQELFQPLSNGRGQTSRKCE